MKELWNTIQCVFMTTREWLGWFLGGYDELLYTLLIFVIVNYVTSIMCDIIDKKLFSKGGFKGIVSKSLIFVLVGISNVLDTQVVVGLNSALRTVIILFYISNEGVSFLQNTKRLGLPIPKKLRDILEQLQE